MTSDTSEHSLERLICTVRTGKPCDPGAIPRDRAAQRPATYGAGSIGRTGAHTDVDQASADDTDAAPEETEP